MKFTPAPWIQFGQDGKTIAILPAGRPGEVCQGTFENEADARLVAHAPQLFNALIDLMRGIRGKTKDTEAYQTAVKVLLLAVGEDDT